MFFKFYVHDIGGQGQISIKVMGSIQKMDVDPHHKLLSLILEFSHTLTTCSYIPPR